MRRRGMLIIGILLLIAGVGIFLYPLISQAISARQQKILMQQVKEQIINNIADINSQSDFIFEDPISSDETDNTDSLETQTSDSSSVSEISDDSNLLANISEEETVEETQLDKSRLQGQKCLGIITIEKINLVYAIVEGTDDANIGVAIGHFKESVGIGQEGNCALAGHNGGTYGRYFGDIKNLNEGDEIIMTDLSGTEYTYNVTEKFVVEPTDVFVVKDLGVSGKYLTMVTCTEHGTKRLIVRALCTSEPKTMRGIH